MDLLLASGIVIGDTDITLYVILGVCGLALIPLIYGGIRGFYRLTWIGWELLIAYGLELLLPAQVNMAVSVLLLIVFSALPLVGEYFLRRVVLTGRVLEQSTGEKVFNHIFGAFTALMGFLMFLVALAGLALPIVGMFMEGGFLDSIPPIVTGHALDFFLIALCLVILRAGCRLGVLKGLNFFLTLVITLGSFFGFFLLFSQVSGGVAFAMAVGGWFGPTGLSAAILGDVILTFFFTILVFVGAMFLSKFLDGLIQKANGNMAVAIPDALILGALYLTVFILIVLGIQAVFGALAGGNFLGSIAGGIGYDFSEIDATIAEYGQKLANFAMSSPISAGLYVGNPFIGGEATASLLGGLVSAHPFL